MTTQTTTATSESWMPHYGEGAASDLCHLTLERTEVFLGEMAASRILGPAAAVHHELVRQLRILMKAGALAEANEIARLIDDLILPLIWGGAEVGARVGANLGPARGSLEEQLQRALASAGLRKVHEANALVRGVFGGNQTEFIREEWHEFDPDCLTVLRPDDPGPRRDLSEDERRIAS